MPEILILGSTDLTLSVAEAAMDVGLSIAAIVHVGGSFAISYSDDRIPVARSAPIADWGLRHDVQEICFPGYDELAARFEGRDIPLCLVAGWYHMVPRRFRELFPLGCLGFHASLLPQLRGGAPLNWAILKEMRETGVTLFELSEGIDDGPIFGQHRIPVDEQATIADLVVASKVAAAHLSRTLLTDIIAGRMRPREQTGFLSYGLQRTREDGCIDWSRSAGEIEKLVRAVGRPYPGAYTRLGETEVTVWAADVLQNPPVVYGAPGQLLNLPECESPCVLSGHGLLAIREAEDDSGADCLELLRRSAQRRFEAR